MASSTELNRRIEEFARELAEEFGELAEEFGELPESDEPLITQFEDQAIEIGDAVMTKILERKLVSAATDDAACCPSCGRPGQCKGDRRRVLQTRRGEVHFSEPEYYCSRCRKAFFPGVQATGD